jgi:hypothetical protein
MSKALQVLKRQIRNGDFDEEFDELVNGLVQAVNQRRRRVRAAMLSEFTTGMRVRTLPGNYKPRYFANREGTITKVESGSVWIELDEPIVRQRGTIYTIGMRGVEYLEVIE